jgi:hypothetical protein
MGGLRAIVRENFDPIGGFGGSGWIGQELPVGKILRIIPICQSKRCPWSIPRQPIVLGGTCARRAFHCAVVKGGLDGHVAGRPKAGIRFPL